MSEWLDLELSHRLAPVEAPEELWNRVSAARPLPRRMPHFRLPVAAAVTVLMAGALYFVAKGQPAPERYRAAAHTDCVLCHTI